MPDLAIAIGNTRIRVAVFEQGILISESAQVHEQLDILVQELKLQKFNKIAIASVVPELITPWHHLSQTQIVTRAMIPITGIYPTIGLDRLLTAWGAWLQYKSPVLVIDCGTAISLTGIDGDRKLIGGAILAGLRMQLQSLNRATALPLVDLPEDLTKDLPKKISSRWATDTNAAIQSGLIYTVVAGLEDFIQDWRSLYPDTKIVFTGGDSKLILEFMDTKIGDRERSQIYLDPNLIFQGIASIF